MIKVLTVHDDIIICKHETGSLPEVGKHYDLSDRSSKSYQQLKLFHHLVTIFYYSGMHPWDYEFNNRIHCPEDLKSVIKYKLGEGFYNVFKDVSIVLSDPIKFSYCLVSLKDYRKNQLSKLISGLIDIMISCGVNTKKFDSIVKEFREL